MKKNMLVVMLLFLFISLSSSAATHPDQVECTDEKPLRGWRMETVGDLETDPPYFFAYWIYKWLFPLKDADCRVREFFKTQDLDFKAGFPVAENSVQKVRLAAVGDIMVKNGLSPQTGPHLFDDVKDRLAGADITFGNLESPIDPSRKPGAFPAYNGTKEQVEMYKLAGFDVFSTANNHVLDKKEHGLLATLDVLDELDVAHVGSSRTIEERDHGFPIIEANNIKIAFLAYTFGTNGRDITPGHEYMVNLVPLNAIEREPDISLIKKHINAARARGADIVIVSLHWNVEFEFYPPRRIIDLGHRVADAGADIILGHHPHVLQPMESYVPSKSERGPAVPETLIVYSLGNFIPDAYTMECKTSLILDIEISSARLKGEKKFWISRVSWTPTWWYGGSFPGKNGYRIINVDKALDAGPGSAKYGFLKEKHFRKLQNARDLTTRQFEPQGITH